MTAERTVIVDNEPLQALADAKHRKHRAVVIRLEGVAHRNRRRAGSMSVIVPTTVRVESGWDRRASMSAALNRLRMGDSPLDRDLADRAARIKSSLVVAVADAHIGALLETTQGDLTVLTSDTKDMHRMATFVGSSATIVRV